MVKKLNLKESVNTMPDNVYDNIALLGYTCSLAANDMHHIHLCAEGDKFQEIHESADNYLGDIRELGDICLELAKEGNIELMSETYALDILKDNGGSDWQVADKASYSFKEAFTEMSNILSDLTEGITLIEDMDGVTSDVISVMDEWARKFSKEVNYFIAKKLGNNEEILMGKNESFNKHRKFKENVSPKDIETVMKAAVNVCTEDDLDAILGSLITINFTMYKSYSEKVRSGKYSPSYLGKCISDDLYDMLKYDRLNKKESFKKCKNMSENYASKYEGYSWLDAYGIMGEVNEVWSFDDLKNYYYNEHDNDPVISVYDNFDDWFFDTIGNMEELPE